MLHRTSGPRRSQRALVLEPSEYDCILGGYGLEAAAAVAAFEAVA